jgi:hypothetical protein
MTSARRRLNESKLEARSKACDASGVGSADPVRFHLRILPGRRIRDVFPRRGAVFMIISCKNSLLAHLMLERVAQARASQEMQMKLAILSAVASIALAVPASTASAQQPIYPISPGPVVVSPPPVVVSPPPVVVAPPPVVVAPVVPAVTIVRPGLAIGIGVPAPVIGFYGRPYYYGPYHYYRR